jgi:Patatin-like phospholipase
MSNQAEDLKVNLNQSVAEPDTGPAPGSNKSNGDKAPLQVHEVLEEEFISLHCPLPADHYKNKEGKDKTPEERLADLYARIHKLDKPRAAFCISGGGIRSGTFALGIIQGLARCGLLDKFHYLSTVSGGGYIGGWLTSWIHRHPKGEQGVVDELKKKADSKIEVEPGPVSHLRSYSNYLSPRLGLLSADTWTLVAIYMRNLILNWLVLVPLIAAVLMVPRIYAAVANKIKVATSGMNWQMNLLLGIGFVLGVIAIGYIGKNRPSGITKNEDRARGQGVYLRRCLLPLLTSTILVTIYWAWFRGDHGSLGIIYFMAFGILTNLLGSVVWVAGKFRSFKRKKTLYEAGMAVIGGVVAGWLLWLAADSNFLFVNVVSEKTPSVEVNLRTRPGSVRMVTDGSEPLLAGKDKIELVTHDGEVELLINSDGKGLIKLRTDSREIALPTDGLEATLLSDAEQDDNNRIRFDFQSETALKDLQLVNDENEAKLVLHEASPDDARFVLKHFEGINTNPETGASEIKLATYQREIKLPKYVCLAVPMLLGVFLLSAFLFNGLISLWTTDEDREWWSRSDAWVLITIVGWAALSALVTFGPFTIGWGQAYVATAGGLSGLVTMLLGRSADTTANKKQSKGSGSIKEYALKLAAPAFAIFLLALIALMTTALLRIISDSALSAWLELHWRAVISIDPSHAQVAGFKDYFENLYTIQWTPLKLVIGFTILLLLISSIMSRFININRYSLHAMYRNRLIRGYLGASNLQPERNNFTGFAENDNLHMHALWPRTQNSQPRKRLFHVVNMALNLVQGDNLAWQERMAESFTATPLHCGNRELGYRSSLEYGGINEDPAKSGITLGTAVAISGAAASPNMGYHSSTFITFLMTLLNARLGWWLGNPGKAGEDTYQREGPYFALFPLIFELLGLTNNRHPYVYLSDGGHFENLGLYEMVLRRCRFIVVSDGSQDDTGNFESLGNAVRKIRIDFGVPIEFTEDMYIYPRSAKKKREGGKFCAIGKIRYSCVGNGEMDGVLVYIKPAFYGSEPRDIYEYAKAHPLFPHESTADQFFTESQFESYRMLGSHIMELLCDGEGQADGFDDWLGKTVKYLYPKQCPEQEQEPLPQWLKKYLVKCPSLPQAETQVELPAGPADATGQIPSSEEPGSGPA